MEKRPVDLSEVQDLISVAIELIEGVYAAIVRESSLFPPMSGRIMGTLRVLDDIQDEIANRQARKSTE